MLKAVKGIFPLLLGDTGQRDTPLIVLQQLFHFNIQWKGSSSPVTHGESS